MECYESLGSVVADLCVDNVGAERTLADTGKLESV